MTEEAAVWESTRPRVDQQLHEIRDGGAFKAERILSTAQGVRIRVGEGDPVLNLCANNYLVYRFTKTYPL